MQLPNNILALVEKYLAGTITPDEKIRLDEWYHSFKDDEVELEMEDEEQEQVFEKIKGRLLNTIYEGQVKKTTGKARKWWLPAAAAAAVFILVFLGYWMFSLKPLPTEIAKKEVVEEKPVNDIVPGGYKAVLTLADGSVILLDSVSNGTISRQGNIKVEKLNKGLLSYTKNSKLATANGEPFYNTISTPRGGQYKITLADGTKVWLNAASSIHFPVAFTGKERKVTITGEAYFEVAKDKARPFKVAANSSEIEVLGTHFNVNAYNDEASIKTTLLEGKVNVSVPALSGKEHHKSLLPGEQAEIHKDGKINVKEHADTEEAVAWVNGYFQFKSADLKTILRQIARWYDVKIEYNNDVNTRFTGQLTRNENVSKVLSELMLTGEVHFKIDGKKIIVSP